MFRRAFTMIELVFVIVVMGILSKFGVEFLAQAYNSFIFSSINNSLQARSEVALETIATKLQFRIKDSAIARDPTAAGLAGVQGVAGANLGAAATVLEWVGRDVDSLRGGALPLWSGIIDLDIVTTTATSLDSPATNTGGISALIGFLSNAGSGINDAALFFTGSDSDVLTGYGWDGNPITTQNFAMHPIRGNGAFFIPVDGATGLDNTFAGTDVSEYYKLSWTAYAVVHNVANGDLTLFYDYQPWRGENFLADGQSSLIMENVETFKFTGVGSIIKLQVCVNSNLVEDYSLCKEKTVF